MACRNVELGNKARDQVLKKNPNSKIHVEQLDLSDNNSITTFANSIKKKYHQIDILVNNAGIAAKGDAFDVDVFNFTFQTVHIYLSQNFYGTIDLTEKILPFISNNGKIVTLGSMAGKMSFLRTKN